MRQLPIEETPGIRSARGDDTKMCENHCADFARFRGASQRPFAVVLAQRFWHNLRTMQHDPQGVGRPASAAVPVPVSKPETPSVDDVVRGNAPTEIGGPSGPEPTRFGDWEKNGRCIDF